MVWGNPLVHVCRVSSVKLSNNNKATPTLEDINSSSSSRLVATTSKVRPRPRPSPTLSRRPDNQGTNNSYNSLSLVQHTSIKDKTSCGSSTSNSNNRHNSSSSRPLPSSNRGKTLTPTPPSSSSKFANINHPPLPWLHRHMLLRLPGISNSRATLDNSSSRATSNNNTQDMDRDRLVISNSMLQATHHGDLEDRLWAVDQQTWRP